MIAMKRQQARSAATYHMIGFSASNKIIITNSVTIMARALSRHRAYWVLVRDIAR
jgi:hypothetical protein